MADRFVSPGKLTFGNYRSAPALGDLLTTSE